MQLWRAVKEKGKDMAKTAVRIVGKNPVIIRSAAIVLEKAGYAVTDSAREADITVIDMPFPLSGIEESGCPLVFLCRDGENVPKNAAAVITKPFLYKELAEKIKPLCKAETEAGDSEIRAEGGGLVKDGKKTALSKKELELFLFFKQHENTAVTREEMTAALWKGKKTSGNITDVYVKYLREKIRKAFGDEPIKSVRGVGYIYSEGSRK